VPARPGLPRAGPSAGGITGAKSWSVTAASPEGDGRTSVAAGTCPQACSSSACFGEKSPVSVSEGDLNTETGDGYPGREMGPSSSGATDRWMPNWESKWLPTTTVAQP
jgi:hypothetical protein